MKLNSKIFFLLGPSGVGKSSFGKYLKHSHGWMHLEIDQYPNDGVDIHRLRKEWNLFYNNHDSTSLVNNLHQRLIAADCSNCVLTFPSNLILSHQHIKSCSSVIHICYLYGSAAHCINTFLKRDHENKRYLDFNHWLSNNKESYIEISKPIFEPFRLHVFIHDGSHRPFDEIYADVLSNFMSEEDKEKSCSCKTQDASLCST
jgi:adenylate kinase family enzyme